jgi:hypothetical protein
MIISIVFTLASDWLGSIFGYIVKVAALAAFNTAWNRNWTSLWKYFVVCFVLFESA